MEVNFKFEIGDVVCSKVDTEQTNRFTILQRHIEECDGGVQLHYRVRGHGFEKNYRGVYEYKGYGKEEQILREMELCAYVPKEVEEEE